MKITKVTYQKAFTTGPFLQEKIGFEAEIGNDWTRVDGELKWETAEIAMTKLKDLAEKWHKENNPHIYQESVPDGINSSSTIVHLGNNQIPVISKDKEKLEIQIDNAKSLEELATLKESCGKAGLVKEYMNKVNQLMVK